MFIRLAFWNLADSETTIDDLRRYVRAESVDEFADVPGLRLTAWISDAATERWGAIHIWESREAAEQQLPTGLSELIGKGPELGEEFDVEATIEGRHGEDELSRRGFPIEDF